MDIPPMFTSVPKTGNSWFQTIIGYIYLRKVARRTASPILSLVLFIGLSSSTLHAQLETGAVLGTVADPSQAVIPGAKVTLSNEETGFTVSTTTAAGGTY